MKKIWLIIGLWLMFGSSAWAGRQTISSLPYTLPTHSADLWDTLYFVDQDTNTSSTIRFDPHPPTTAQSAIRFTTGNNYWRVLFANDTILFGGDSTAQQFFVFEITATNPKANHIEIFGKNSTTKRGYILSDCAAWTGTETRADLSLPRDTAVYYNPTAIRTAGSQVKIFNMKIEVKGFSHIDGGTWQGIQCIYARDGQGTEIYNNELINRASAFNDRQYYPSPCLRAECPNPPLAPDTLNHYIHDNIITSYSTHGIVTQLQFGKFLLKNNNIMLDGRQAMEDGPNEFWGLTHSFGILCNAPGRGSRITHNTITSGTSYRGGQGIFFVNDDTTQIHTGFILVDSNHVDVHNGRTTKYPWELNMGSAIKLRNLPRYVRCFGNTFIYTCDTTHAAPTGNTQSAYMPQGSCIEYQWYQPAPFSTQDVQFYNNLCSLNVVSNTSTPLYRITAFRFTDVGFTAIDPTFQVYQNRIAGRMNWAYEFGTNLGLDLPSNARNILIERDTIRPVVWNDITTITDAAAYNGNSSNNNILRDCYFSGIAPSEGSYYQISSSGRQPASFVISLPNDFNNYYQRTLNVNVKGGLNGRPVSGATVTVTNAYGQLVASGSTNSIGAYNPTVSYRWYSMNSADSAAFNNFTFAVSKSGDNGSSIYSVNWNAYTDTVTLPATNGDGMWPGADDVVARRTRVVSMLPTNYTPLNYLVQLRGPKRQIIPLNRTAGAVVVYTASPLSTYNIANLTRYVNGVETDHVLAPTPTTNAYYEASLCVTDGDTIIWCANNASAYTASLRVIRVDASVTPMQIIDVQDINTGALASGSGGYESIAVPTTLGGDDIIIECRMSGSSSYGSTATQIIYARSNDGGTTWLTPTLAYADARVIRSGIEPYTTGTAFLSSVIAASAPIVVFFRQGYFDGVSWSTTEPAPQVINAAPAAPIYAHREYGFAATDGGYLHYIFSDSSTPSSVVHARKQIGVGSWVYDTLYTAPIKVGNDATSSLQGHLEVGISYARSSGVIRVAYGKVETVVSGNGSDQVLYGREWLAPTSTWGNEYRISSDDSVWYLVQPNRSPSVQGDRTWWQYAQRTTPDGSSTSGWQIELAEVLGDGASGGTIADPTGACCLSSGTCVTTTSADCISQGGTYQGDGIVCDAGTCSAPVVTNAAEAITGNVTFEGNVRVE